MKTSCYYKVDGVKRRFKTVRRAMKAARKRGRGARSILRVCRIKVS